MVAVAVLRASHAALVDRDEARRRRIPACAGEGVDGRAARQQGVGQGGPAVVGERPQERVDADEIGGGCGERAARALPMRLLPADVTAQPAVPLSRCYPGKVGHRPASAEIPGHDGP